MDEPDDFTSGSIPISLHFVHHDAAAADDLRVCRVDVLRSSSHVVVNNGAVCLVPNLDAELVHATATVHLAIRRGEQEAEVAAAIDGAETFVLRLGTRDDKPLIRRALEVKVGEVQLELGLARGNGCALLVLRHKAEVRFPAQRQVSHIRARR